MKNLFLLFISLLLHFCPTHAYPYGISDTLKNTPPDKQSDLLWRLSADKVFLQHRKASQEVLAVARNLSENHVDPRFLVRFFLLKGRIYAMRDQGTHPQDSSFFYLYRAAEYAEYRKLVTEQTEALLASASLHQSNGRYREALQDVEHALEVVNNHPEVHIRSIHEQYLMISRVYYQVNNLEKSLAYGRAGEKFMADTLQNYNMYRQLAIIYRELQDYDASDHYYKKCIAVSHDKHDLTLLNYANADLKYNQSLRDGLHLKRKMRLLYLALAILSLVLVAIAFLYFKRELYVKQQEADFLLKERIYLEKMHQEVSSDLQKARNKLSMLAHQMQERGRIIEKLKENSDLSGILSRQEYRERLTQLTILTEDEWINFKNLFDLAFPGITTSLKERYPALTAAELRLISLTYLNISSQAMSSMLGISTETVRKTRQRLRKKIDIWEQEHLHEWLARFVSMSAEASNFAELLPFMRNKEDKPDNASEMHSEEDD